MAEQVDEELTAGGESLADVLGPPLFLEFDEEEVVTELVIREESRIKGEVFVDQTTLPAVGVTGPVGTVP